MENKRIEWVDVIKFICIYFVVLSHFFEYLIAPQLRLFYAPIFLTGFLFVSGYTYRPKNSFKEHLIKKIKQLLMPAFTFGVAALILSSILTFNPEKHLDLIGDLKRNMLQIHGYGDTMWFVNALFVAYIPFYFLIKNYEKAKATKKNATLRYLLICISLLIIKTIYERNIPGSYFPWGLNTLPWHIEYIPYAMFFMYLGYIFKEKYEEVLDQRVTIKNLLFILLIYLVIIYVPNLLDIKFGIFINIYTRITELVGVLLVVVTSKIIKPSKSMLYVGQNTLIYFGIHGKAIALIEKIIEIFLPNIYFYILNHDFVSTLYSLIGGYVLIMLLIIPTYIINKYLPFMMCKWYNIKTDKN